MSVKSKIEQLKYRWKSAPTWVKVVDLCCWGVLFTLVGYVVFGG